MTLKIKLAAFLVIWSTVSTTALRAEDRWASTTAGTFSWTDTTRWSSAAVPGNEDVRITNNIAGSLVITNAGQGSGTINYLAISNSTAGTTTVIQQSNTSWTASFGASLGQNAILILTTNAQLGTDISNTFDLNAGGQKGTLILSNAANVAAFSLFVVKGTVNTANTNAIVNAGTIQVNPQGAGQVTGLNYGQTLGFTNLSTGTIVKSGLGSGTFVGNFGSQNRVFINSGTLIVNAGTQRIDPRDAFNAGGFRNDGTGFVRVDTGAVVEVRRTINAWANSNVAPTNFGTVFMNGGDLRTFDTDGLGATNVARVVDNANTGIIRGNGLLDFTLRNETGGIIEARDGTLTTVSSANNNGTWVSTNFGGNVAVLNFTTRAFDLGGGTLLNSNGNLRLTSGANMTISTSYRQNWGTIDFAGDGTLLIPNSASADSLTNEWVIKKSASGSATITTGYGAGGPPNYGFYNRGTLDISGGGRLTLNTSNSFFQTFQNLSTGTIVIGGSSTARIARTSAAWSGGTRPLNFGTLTLNGGVLEAADDTGLTTTQGFENRGLIQGTGTVNTTITSLGGTISPGFSVGRLDITGNAFLSNTAVNVELGVGVGQNDLIAFAGSLLISSNVNLNITGGTVGNVYTVMTYAARVGFNFYTNTPNYSVGYGTTVLTVSPQAILRTISASAGANGTITPSGSVSVTNGNNQSFTITPNSCYSVGDVLVDGGSVGAVTGYTFTNVTTDHTISASFNTINYTINASAGANGSISPNGAVSAGCGTNQVFTITPNTGYHIADVLVDSLSVGPVNSYTFTGVAASHTISASFAINTYTVNASAGSGGTITPNGAVSVNYGDNQGFTINANPCHSIADVLVDSISVGPVSDYTFTNITANHTIDASFTLNTYTITATAGTNGSINPAGAVVVNCGTNQDFTITPNAGHPIVDVLVDSISVGPVSSYTFSNVVANHTIDASFAAELFRVLSISRQGNDVLLTWPTAGGHDYIVQSTTGAGGNYTNNFTDLATYTIPGIGESTTNHLDIGGATNSPSNYYRIRLP